MAQSVPDTSTGPPWSEGRQPAWHALDARSVLQKLDASDKGLSAEEAGKRQQQYGFNEIAETPPTPRWKLFASQFRSAVVWLLIAAAIISGALGEWIDTAAILSIVLLNGILGFLQEDRSRRALQALEQMSAPLARALRDGHLQNVPARELEPGDILQLESGDSVAADARLLTASRLGALEAALTGESSPVEKAADLVLDEETQLADRRNMVYAGTTISAGKAQAVVVATGMRTQLGRIAELLEAEPRQVTPLERRLDELGRMMMAVCLVLVAIIFSLQLWRGGSLVEVFLSAVSLAVAAVPEGLPAVVTMALALGLERMVRRNALVRKLPSVETLGSVTVICTDKTGTLTRNEMTVLEIVAGDQHYQVSGVGFEPRGDFRRLDPSGSPATDVSQSTIAEKSAIDPRGEPDLLVALWVAARCTSAELVGPKDDKPWHIVGDPTEGALLVAAAKAGVERDDVGDQVVYEIPFESERKAMSLVVIAGGRRRMCTKGAPEVVLGWSNYEWQGNRRRPISTERRQQWLTLADQMAGRALRVLAVAEREYSLDYQGDYQELELTLVGLLGMMDPPRAEATEAVRRCRAAGIRPVMITGDHPATALAIGRELTIATSDRVATGKDLDAMSDERLADEVEELSVYARVTAEHKQRIVRALKQRGHIVAMTGDGVNDAPAIVAADIGIAMGRTGTDVTKAASDMVLTDDNFSSIVNAVEEGRGIFENIQKVVQFLLSCNAGEVMFMFFAALVGWPLPLLAIHLLWMNLITDGLPALTLGMEPPEPDIMARPPRPPHQPVVTLARGLRMAAYGALFAVSMALGFGYVYYSEGGSLESARTVAFCVACYGQIFFAFGCRSDHFTAPQLGLFTNRPLLLAMAVSSVLQLGTVLLPLGQRIFETTDITADQWLLILGLALAPVTLVELSKFLPRRNEVAQQPAAGA